MSSKITMHRLTCTVAVGATTASVTSKPIRGRIISVKVVYSNTTPASSSDRDTNLFELNSSNAAVAKALQEILNIGGLGAAPDDDNDVYYPRVPSQDITGTDVTYDGTNEIYEPFMIFGLVHLAVSAAAAGDITTVYLMVEEY